MRAAHDHLEVTYVANYDDADRERLMGNVEIIQNRLKIEAGIHDAGMFLKLQESHGSVAARLTSHNPRSKED